MREIEEWEPRTLTVKDKTYNITDLLDRVSRRKNLNLRDKKRKTKRKSPPINFERIWMHANTPPEQLALIYPLLNNQQLRHLHKYAQRKCRETPDMIKWIKDNAKDWKT